MRNTLLFTRLDMHFNLLVRTLTKQSPKDTSFSRFKQSCITSTILAYKLD